MVTHAVVLVLKLNRQNPFSLLKNKAFASLVVGLTALIGFLIFGGPSCVHCLLRINCDLNGTKRCAPWLAKLFNVRTCLTGPENAQVIAEQGDMVKFMAENDCQENLFAPRERGECLGGNLCLSREFAGSFAFVMMTLFCGVIALNLFINLVGRRNIRRRRLKES